MQLSCIEHNYIQEFSSIAGLDEAGRGPWAGPVVVAGVTITSDTPCIEGVTDSKKLTAAKRKALYEEIIKTHPYAVRIVSPVRIDEKGIGVVIIEAMNQVIQTLAPDFALIDGYFPRNSFTGKSTCIIKGDGICYCIGAASIIAKHVRDTIMEMYKSIYPAYGFERHKGYGTPEHLHALKEFGVTPIHRKSYKPVMNLSGGNE